MLSRQNGTGVEALVPFYFTLIPMLILLAESKTMSADQKPVEASEYEAHKPALDEMADNLMSHLETLTPAEISNLMGISMQLAVKTHNLAYDFPHKLTGQQAIYSFTGEAFRGLDVKTMTQEALDRAVESLKFISSVYGILNSSDIIKPYRCEFNKKIVPGDKTPIDYYKQKVTVELVNYIKDNKIQDVINLLPSDADKCVDWKIVRAFAKVHKVVFQSITQDGKLKTPIAQKLKELRGKMARTILMEDISSFQELINFSSPHFIFSPKDSKPLLPVFISD